MCSEPEKTRNLRHLIENTPQTSGCTSCKDCGDQEDCVDGSCRPVLCSAILGPDFGASIACSVSPEVGTSCLILAADGKVIKGLKVSFKRQGHTQNIVLALKDFFSIK